MQSRKLSDYETSFSFIFIAPKPSTNYTTTISNCFTEISIVRSRDTMNDIFKQFDFNNFSFFQELDFEVELAFVIGKTGKKIKV